MTTELYLADSTVRSFEATVERALDDRVVLDRTHFYPTGGGQPHDTGRLAVGELSAADGTDTGEPTDGGEPTDRTDEPTTVRVTDVTKKDTIYHTVEGPTPTEGARVVGELDWGRRYAHMRYHTAQHLLSATLLDEFDAPTVGNQVYADRARLDCEHDRFSETELRDLETRLNELIDRELPVRHYTMERDRAERELDTDRTRIDLLPESITELRIVEIGDRDDPFDRTACAGTHVAATDELGGLTVTGRRTQGSDTERVTFELDD